MELSLQQVVYKTERGTPVTDSVKVAQVFCKMHKNVLKSIRNLAAQNLAAKSWFHEITYLDGRGQTQPMFLMNRDGFSSLAMSLTGEKALQFKVGFIQQFDAMEAALKEIAPTRPAIPQTFAQALRLAAEQAETIENQERQIEAQRKQLADQEDDVKFVRSLQTADTSIYITDLAKLIAQNGVDIGGIRLFKWMRDNGFLTLDNKPTQRAVDLGVFEIKTSQWENPKTGEMATSFTTLVTVKGQKYFINKFIYKSEHP